MHGALQRGVHRVVVRVGPDALHKGPWANDLDEVVTRDDLVLEQVLRDALDLVRLLLEQVPRPLEGAVDDVLGLVVEQRGHLVGVRLLGLRPRLARQGEGEVPAAGVHAELRHLRRVRGGREVVEGGEGGLRGRNHRKLNPFSSNVKTELLYTRRTELNGFICHRKQRRSKGPGEVTPPGPSNTSLGEGEGMGGMQAWDRPQHLRRGMRAAKAGLVHNKGP